MEQYNLTMKIITYAFIALICTAWLMALTGCASYRPKVSRLPDLVEYPREFQAGMKKELPTVRQCCPNSNTFIRDSVKLRDKIRAAKKVEAK